jgi:hypothetical protein
LVAQGLSAAVIVVFLLPVSDHDPRGLWTTEPVAQQVARKAAGEALTNFNNVFRAETGKAEYTDEHQSAAALNFLEILQKQSDDFVEESRDQMRAAGFVKTPWDNWQRKTPRTP